jgi:hypothetical protein
VPDDARLLAILLLVCSFFALVYGVTALRRVSRLSQWRPPNGPPGDPDSDVPRFVFEGERFEERFQGSRGYEQLPRRDRHRFGHQWGRLIGSGDHGQRRR